MGENDIEVLAAGIDDCCQTDDLRTGSDNDDELELTIVLEMDVTVIELWGLFHCCMLFYFFSTGSKYVSGRLGLNISLQYITVTRSCVSERLMMLWVYPGSMMTLWMWSPLTS